MIWSKTVLVSSRLKIFVDNGQNQRLQYFRSWTEEMCRHEVPTEVSLPGFGIWMINEDFHMAEI